MASDQSWCSQMENFCYVCGNYMAKFGHVRTGKKKTQIHNADLEFKQQYETYFKQPVLLGETYTPKFVCHSCFSGLSKWWNHEQDSLSFSKPMIWEKDPDGHVAQDCYACVNSPEPTKIKKYIDLKSTEFTSRPLPNVAGVDAPKAPPKSVEAGASVSTSNYEELTDINDPTFELPEGYDFVPFTQNVLDYMAAKMGLTQEKAEYFVNSLKKHCVTAPDVISTAYRRRQKAYQPFFTNTESKKTAYCNNVSGLIQKMGLDDNPNDWRLFIDGSSSSLKAILLHKTNRKPTIPLFYSTEMKEDYASLKKLLQFIRYDNYKWKVCCDLKVVNILCGLQPGWPHFFCFKCDWDTREKVNHYTYKGWTGQNPDMLRGQPLVDVKDVLIPPLHVKLGIVQKFLALLMEKYPNEAAFECVKEIVKLSDAKINKGY